MQRRVPLAVGLDTFAVVLFVALGRREHERGSSISGLIETAAPFLIALVAGVARPPHLEPTDRLAIGHRRVGRSTLGVGMAVRAIVFGDGTAMSFVIVAALFLALTLIGWRLVFGAIERRRLRDRGDTDEPCAVQYSLIDRWIRKYQIRLPINGSRNHRPQIVVIGGSLPSRR